jgi:hypothetical protein
LAICVSEFVSADFQYFINLILIIMKILLTSIALAAMSFAPLTTSDSVTEVVADCTVTLDCGNGSSASGTASSCKKAGSIAGAGCDAAME